MDFGICIGSSDENRPTVWQPVEVVPDPGSGSRRWRSYVIRQGIGRMWFSRCRTPRPVQGIRLGQSTSPNDPGLTSDHARHRVHAHREARPPSAKQALAKWNRRRPKPESARAAQTRRAGSVIDGSYPPGRGPGCGPMHSFSANSQRGAKEQELLRSRGLMGDPAMPSSLPRR